MDNVSPHYGKSPPPYGEGLCFRPNYLYTAYWSAENLAKEYLAYRKALENEVTGRHGIYDRTSYNYDYKKNASDIYWRYTAYIDGWDDSLGVTEWTVDGEIYTEQEGLAIITDHGYKNRTTSPWCGECELPVRDYYLGHAGVYNRANVVPSGTRATEAECGMASIDRYIVCPLEQLRLADIISTRNTIGFEPYYYEHIEGNPGNVLSVSMREMADVDIGALAGLGVEWFPAVITATQEIKAKLCCMKKA